MTGTTLSYVAAAGEVNDTSMFLVDIGSGLGQAVRELGTAPVVAGAGCTAVDSQMVWCGATPTAMDVDLGDLDDTFHSNDLGGTVHGGAGNDVLNVSQFNSGALYGDGGNDRLLPAMGNWTLSGGDGDDALFTGCAGGCSGDETLTASGGTGTDSFSYLNRIGPVTVTLDGVANDGEAGHHNIGADIETLVGSDGADTLVGNGADDRIEGGPGADTMQGAGGDDVLVDVGDGNQFGGGADDDTFVSAGAVGTDNNAFAGGAGVDTVDFSGREAGLSVTLDGLANDGGGHENVGADVENVIGSSQADALTGDADANRLDGGGDDDLLRGGTGADELKGGAGRDTADYSDHAGGVLIAANGQAESGDATDGSAGARDTIGPDVENFTGGAGGDLLVDSAAANTFSGGAGIDTADYSAATAPLTVSLDDAANDGPAGQGDDVGADVENVLAGAVGDTLLGSAGANRLEGGGGNDLLRGGDGADTLLGGAGEDTADYSERTAGVTVVANGAADSGSGADGPAGARDTVGTDVEDLVGGSGPDSLTGNGLANVLGGGAGADSLRGGPGRDTADYSSRTRDVVVDLDGAANDGEAGEGDNVGPSGDVEDVRTGSGADLLFGNAAANALSAGAGDDLLDGGPGPDTYQGGAGDDVVSYLDASGPVTAAIDGRPTSGGAADTTSGQRDTIAHDIEDLWGGPANDQLTGDEGDNLLYGGNGADTLIGHGGFDAADYSDRTAGIQAALDGLPNSGNAADGPAGGRDRLAADIEVLIGGDGPDALSGNSAENFFDAGPGADVINSRDASEDADLCGDGQDVALIDDLDDYDDSCELAYLPGQEPQPKPPGTSTPRDTTPPRISLARVTRQRLSRVLAKGLIVRVNCSEACTLDGRLTLDAKTARRRHLTKGRRAVTVARGRAGTGGRLALRFSKKARKRLRGMKRIRLTLVLRATDRSGNTAVARRHVTLKPARASISSRAADGQPSTLLAHTAQATRLVQRKIARRPRG